MPSCLFAYFRKVPSRKSDRVALEKSIRGSSLLPSILTPSRQPFNSAVASSRAPFFQRAPLFIWEKETIREWYSSCQCSSTAIKKLQLRKEYYHPYHYEFIVVFTRGGYTYRVDRRPDPNTPFDTIIRTGCTAYDMIESVEPSSFEANSETVVELRWQGEQTIDLLHILSICFGVRNDEQAKQYTLQCYNCYFLSWTIIVSTMRTTMVDDWKPMIERLAKVLGQPNLGLYGEMLCKQEEKALSPKQNLGGARFQLPVGHQGEIINLQLHLNEMQTILSSVQGRLKVEQEKRVREQEREREQELAHKRECERTRERVQNLEWGLEQGHVMEDQYPGQPLVSELVLERERERAYKLTPREWKRERDRKRDLELKRRPLLHQVEIERLVYLLQDDRNWEVWELQKLMMLIWELERLEEAFSISLYPKYSPNQRQVSGNTESAVSTSNDTCSSDSCQGKPQDVMYCMERVILNYAKGIDRWQLGHKVDVQSDMLAAIKRIMATQIDGFSLTLLQ